MRIAITFLLFIALQDKSKQRPDQGAGIAAGKDAVELKLKQLKKDPKDAKEKDVEVKLSDFKGKQPVVLIFGSYT
jgi:hypothetical protein